MFIELKTCNDDLYVFILIPGHSVPEVECPRGVGANQEGGGHVNHC